MERKDWMGLLVVLVAGALVLYGIGRDFGGVTPDPILGTFYLYVGLAVAGAGSVLWLWLALRPLWTLKLPRGFVITFHHRDKRGPSKVWPTEAVALPARPFSTWIKLNVTRPIRCYGFAVETTAPLGMAHLNVRSGRGFVDGWEEVLSQPHCINFVRKEACALGPGDRLEINLESAEPVDLERLRLIKERSAKRLTQLLD